MFVYKYTFIILSRYGHNDRLLNTNIEDRISTKGDFICTHSIILFILLKFLNFNNFNLILICKHTPLLGRIAKGLG